MDYQTKMQEWLSSPLVDEKDKEQIRVADEETKKEMFSSDLHFGTAGMRALLGPGSARLNLLTVRRATIGVALFLLERYGQEACKTRGFAISFDNRHYSKEFRDTAAKVLTELGFNVYTFRDPHPTPELSYTVRFFHCVGGLMLTASHNPKEYNGYKFYDEEGCQGVYEVIDGLIAKIDSLPDELHASYTPVAKEKQGTVTYLDDSEKYDEDFTDKEVSTSLYKDVYEGERLTKIVFTPECGCDCKVGPMVLRKAGYTVLDADEIAHQAYLPDNPCYAQIIEHFDVLEEGAISRTKLGAIVFRDEKARKQLEDIIHPYVRSCLMISEPVIRPDTVI